jgi:hypothetical protein
MLADVTSSRDFAFALGSLRANADATLPPDDIEWASLITKLDAHTLTPLLFSVWSQTAYWDRIPEPVRQRLTQAYFDNSHRQELIKTEVLEIHQILAGAKVPHIMLKGWSLAERLYSDPALRLTRDHDFLVPVEAAKAGYRALLAHGFRPLPGGDEAVEKHERPVWRNDDRAWSGYIYDPAYPRPVELHTRLWEKTWRGLTVRELPDLWSHSLSTSIAGTPMLILNDEYVAVHLAMHFAGHWIEREPRLSQLFDLALLLAKATALDWDEVGRQVDRSLSRFVYVSFWLANAIFGAPLPPAEYWHRLRSETPGSLSNWLHKHAVDDLMSIDYRFRRKGKDYDYAFGSAPTAAVDYVYAGRDYELTLLAADNLLEGASVLRFAALPPAYQLNAKYGTSGLMGLPWLYARHISERIWQYGQALARRTA